MVYGPEDTEQIAFVEWLNWRNIPHWCIRNEDTIKNKSYLGKLKRMGRNPGVSDLLVIIPKTKCNLDKDVLLFVEMKRKKEKGVYPRLSEAQKDFLGLVNKVENVGGYTCFGADEAIQQVEKFLR